MRVEGLGTDRHEKAQEYENHTDELLSLSHLILSFSLLVLFLSPSSHALPSLPPSLPPSLLSFPLPTL